MAHGAPTIAAFFAWCSLLIVIAQLRLVPLQPGAREDTCEPVLVAEAWSTAAEEPGPADLTAVTEREAPRGTFAFPLPARARSWGWLQVHVQPGHPLARTPWNRIAQVWIDGRPGGDTPLAPDTSTLFCPLEVPLEVRVAHGALEGRAQVPAGAWFVAVPLEPFRHLEVELTSAAPARDDGVVVRFTPARRDARTDIDRIDLTDRRRVATFDVPENLGGVLSLEWDGVTLERRVRSDERVVRLALPGAGELLWTGDPRARLETTVDGTRYRAERHGHLTSLPAGPARVVVRLDEHVATALVDVRAGRVTEIDLPLAAGATLRGRLVDPRGRPVAGELEVAGLVCRVEPDGRFALGPVPPGRWILAAVVPEQLPARSGAQRAWLPERVVEVLADDLDLGDLAVEVE